MTLTLQNRNQMVPTPGAVKRAVHQYELHRNPRSLSKPLRGRSSRVAQAFRTWWRQQVRCQAAGQANPAQLGIIPAKNLRKGAVYFDVRADEFMGIPMNIFDLVDSVLNIVAFTNSEATSSEAR
jgi:hypothetical protein